jgi:predicted CXXCH cytochrome family protein
MNDESIKPSMPEEEPAQGRAATTPDGEAPAAKPPDEAPAVKPPGDETPTPKPSNETPLPRPPADETTPLAAAAAAEAESTAAEGDATESGAGDATEGAADTPAAASAAGGGKRRRHSLIDVVIPRAWLWGLIAAVIAILAVVAISFAVVNRVGTCSACHLIQPEVASYKTTAHYKAGVGCQSCHTKPGVFRYFVRNLQGVTNVIGYISGHYQKPLTTYVGAENCVQCHPKSQIEKDVIVGNIRVNHKGLREAGFQCVTCHDDVAHGSTGPFGARPKVDKMSICVTCHNGVNQPRTCSICHLNGVPAGAQKVAMTVHIGVKNCQGCHSANFCGKCHHGVAMPHPQRWNGIAHGKFTLQHGAATCATCHQAKNKTFCIGCHKLPMPHPATWLSSGHPSVGLSKPQLCQKCHGANSCLRCHGLTMPHPGGWLSQHGSVALRGSGVCTKCHSQSFCINCHGLVLPHPSSFRASHPALVIRSGGLCVKCHGNAGSGPKGCFGGNCHQGGVTP